MTFAFTGEVRIVIPCTNSLTVCSSPLGLGLSANTTVLRASPSVRAEEKDT